MCPNNPQLKHCRPVNTIPLYGRPVTRALASTMRASFQLITSSEVATTTQINQGQVLRGKNSKRTALDEKKGNAHKKRAVLKDITNVNCENSYTSCFNAAKIQVENIKQIKKGRSSSSKVASSSATSEVTDAKLEVVSKSSGSSSNSTVDTSCIGGKSTIAISRPKFVDIDSNAKDPLLCSPYAPEIYKNLRVAELKHKPVSDSMKRTQTDVTQTMRGILVDWLVEVISEEYALVPNTLDLTYEEICAPRVEEFCFITDNAYTRDQVLEMESQNPCVEIEFLVNYLTELTLIDYQFLKFLPSVIAASAVFLAKWTLNQFSHPWNPTLEHYTGYKASDLKVSTHALQDLQRNTKGCPLNSIRMKYRQEKFQCVVVYTSLKLPHIL
ncbi:hypothetical protein EUTSA_v10029347mg [Eutrema salsugineum]|uniref:Cyclin N-terminal domain-containing protein n=1 Tax=Eutrema salsugineum TaxID=72664 RepID=V4L8J4_EUTSA|nr:hypothetical protein EUTSA_v10029347mg [Eutrema salsugineum]